MKKVVHKKLKCECLSDFKGYTLCVTHPVVVREWYWEEVTCKRCLRHRPKRGK